jgi:hypothetical protein
VRYLGGQQDLHSLQEGWGCLYEFRSVLKGRRLHRRLLPGILHIGGILQHKPQGGLQGRSLRVRSVREPVLRLQQQPHGKRYDLRWSRQRLRWQGRRQCPLTDVGLHDDPDGGPVRLPDRRGSEGAKGLQERPGGLRGQGRGFVLHIGKRWALRPTIWRTVRCPKQVWDWFGLCNDPQRSTLQ